ncbi:SDR family NAD(P)-dependent oxidoreductase [Falsibacillus pallidus]|uniref:SDR family NAD(P)-dependent oxidoreductase n=1 Tax=Falsibacillus pallidus TaxID=493781 RepID=UPI003D97A859
MKKIVITGAGTGLGKEMALQYADNDVELHLVGRSLQTLEETAAEAEKSGAKVYVHAADITVESEVKHIAAEIEEDGPVDVLVNNAGVGMFGPFMESTSDQMEAMFRTNSFGPIYLAKAFIPGFLQQNKGTIINIISTAGLRGKKNESLYVASKFALRGFTESLQQEYADTGLRIVAAYMGGMNTPFWDETDHIKDKSRLRTPKEVAEIIVKESAEKTEIVIESNKK